MMDANQLMGKVMVAIKRLVVQSLLVNTTTLPEGLGLFTPSYFLMG